MPQIGRRDLPRAVVSGIEFGDPRRINVEADTGAGAAESDRDRKSDIAEADDGDKSRMRHAAISADPLR